MQSSAAQRRPLAAAGAVVAVALIAGVVFMALAADADWRVGASPSSLSSFPVNPSMLRLRGADDPQELCYAHTELCYAHTPSLCAVLGQIVQIESNAPVTLHTSTREHEQRLLGKLHSLEGEMSKVYFCVCEFVCMCVYMCGVYVCVLMCVCASNVDRSMAPFS